MSFLAVEHNQLTGTLPFTHSTWFGRTSLPLQSRGGGGGGSAGGVASGVASCRALKDVLRRTFCVVHTWRTGQEEFNVFMEKKVPSCDISV
jgi:hypothetical protein